MVPSPLVLPTPEPTNLLEPCFAELPRRARRAVLTAWFVSRHSIIEGGTCLGQPLRELGYPSDKVFPFRRKYLHIPFGESVQVACFQCVEFGRRIACMLLGS